MLAILLLVGQTVPQSETGTGKLKHVCVEREAIEEGGSQSLITADEFGPLRKRDCGGDNQTDMLMERGQTTKEQIRSRLGERDKPDFIQDNEIEPKQVGFHAGEPVCSLRFEELVG